MKINLYSTLEQAVKFSKFLTEAKIQNFIFWKVHLFCSSNKVCTSARKLTSKNSWRTWGCCKESHHKVSGKSQIHPQWSAHKLHVHWQWGKLQNINMWESLEVFTSPSCFLAPPSHGTVLPGPEIWESTGSGAMRQPEWCHFFYNCAYISVKLLLTGIFPK